MKKKHSLLLSLVFAIAIAMAIFACFNLTNKNISIAEGTQTTAEETLNETTPFDFFSITQSNYVFSEEVFASLKDKSQDDLGSETEEPTFTPLYNSVKVDGLKTYYIGNYNLTTTKTIAICLTNEPLTTNYYAKISVTANNTTETIIDTQNSNFGTNGVGYRKDINGKAYYIFELDKNQDTNKALTLTITYRKPVLNNKGNPTGQYLINYYTANINLTQVTNKFESNPPFEWSYKKNYNSDAQQEITAPSNGCTYQGLTLTPSTTAQSNENNPLYIKFTYCGEQYELQYKNGKFYNLNTNAELNIEKLTFDVSGLYTVEVFDNTYFSGYPNANYYSYNFIIENGAIVSNNISQVESLFYFDVRLEDGTILPNSPANNPQVSTADQTTRVNFVNLDKIDGRITDYFVRIQRTYQPTSGENIDIYTTYEVKDLKQEKDSNPYIELEEDGRYVIIVYRAGTDPDTGTAKKVFEFSLLKDIKANFSQGGYDYQIGENEPSNEKKNFVIQTSIKTEYKGITGQTDNKYNVVIARSAPSINGVKDNGRTSEPVTITVKGVGTINVSVTKDGSTVTQQLENGQSLSPISDTGKYFIKITDEMGTTITKNFTITIKMNGAAIALIIVAAIIILVMLISVIASRTKIKVR